MSCTSNLQSRLPMSIYAFPNGSYRRRNDGQIAAGLKLLLPLELMQLGKSAATTSCALNPWRLRGRRYFFVISGSQALHSRERASCGRRRRKKLQLKHARNPER